VGRYCVYLLVAGGRIAYAGSSGRVEERLRRHFRGYSSAAARGLRPDAAYVLACTRSKSLALAWKAWLHKAYQPPYAAKTPAKRPRKPPGGTSHKPRSTSQPARRLAGMNARRRSSSPEPRRGTG
jgi:predicted GIY-YIG superfamily endonuclease